jgi:hypothetical protein
MKDRALNASRHVAEYRAIDSMAESVNLRVPYNVFWKAGDHFKSATPFGKLGMCAGLVIAVTALGQFMLACLVTIFHGLSSLYAAKAWVWVLLLLLSARGVSAEENTFVGTWVVNFVYDAITTSASSVLDTSARAVDVFTTSSHLEAHWRRFGELPNMTCHLPNFKLPRYYAPNPLLPPRPGCHIQVPSEYVRPRVEWSATSDVPLIGMSFARAPFVPEACLHNELVGINNRLCLQRPVVTAGSRLKTTMMALVAPKPIAPANFDDWNSRFTKGRQKDHALALVELNYAMDDQVMRRNQFVKVEKLMKADPTIFPDPRSILGRRDPPNVALGPIMWAFSKELAKQWNGTNPIMVRGTNVTIFYASGHDGDVLDELYTEHAMRFTHVDEVDASRWDAHMQRVHLEAEQTVYKAFNLYSYPHVRAALESQYDVKGVSRHGVRFSAGAARGTGDPNTSCGNSLINAAIIVDIYADFCANLSVWVLGDDSLIFHDGCGDEAKIIEAYVARGLKVKFKRHTSFAGVSFCSQIFYPTGSGYVFGPMIGRWLARAGWMAKLPSRPRGYTDERWRATLLRGNMLSLGGFADFVPFVRKYYAAAMAYTHGLEDTAEHTHQWTRANPTNKPDGLTWAFILERYGLNEWDEKQFESLLLSVKWPALVDWQPIHSLVSIDL